MTPDRGASFERHAATRIRGALHRPQAVHKLVGDASGGPPTTPPRRLSDFRARLDATPRPLLERAAEAGAAAPAPA